MWEEEYIRWYFGSFGAMGTQSRAAECDHSASIISLMEEKEESKIRDCQMLAVLERIKTLVTILLHLCNL